MNLLAQFDKFATQIPVDTDLQKMRLKAVEYLNVHGLPTRKDGDWKYTSVKHLNDENFLPAALEHLQPSHETLKAIQAKLSSDFTNIVFHNGVFNRTLSTVEDLPFGVHFKEAGVPVANTGFKDSFEALNAAYFVKNYTLDIPAETTVKRPVNLLFFTSLEKGPAVMTNPRLTINV